MILVALPAIVLVVFTVLAFFGNWWWVLDLLAAFRPQYTLVLAALGLVLVAVRWRRIGAVTLVGALVNAAVVVPLYFGPSNQGLRSGESLLVLSFNVKADVSLFDPVVDLIRRTDPDVVFIHEATPGWEDRARLAGLEYSVVASRNTGVRFGTLVLGPADMQTEGFGFAESEPRAVEVRLPTTVGEVALLGIHPLSPTNERRSGIRDAQLDYAAQWAQAEEGRSVVVGDFNATPWSWSFRRIETEAGLVNSLDGFGVQATFPAGVNPLFRVPIDHLLHSDGLEVIDRRLGPSFGSDHYPLFVELALVR